MNVYPSKQNFPLGNFIEKFVIEIRLQSQKLNYTLPVISERLTIGYKVIHIDD